MTVSQDPGNLRPGRLIDPRAVRITRGGPAEPPDRPAMVVEPPAVPVSPAPRAAGFRVDGGRTGHVEPLETADPEPAGIVLVDGEPTIARLERFDDVHAVLVEAGADGDERRTSLLLLSLEGSSAPGSGTVGREVVVEGWSVRLEIESERRAALRERAGRGREASARGGPTEVRAIIPGRVLSVSVAPGDAVVAGQQLLVIEAMKMQNELRAPRDGTVTQVAVGTGRTIELGDLLLVLA